MANTFIKTAIVALGLGIATAAPMVGTAQAQEFRFGVNGGNGQPSFGFSIGDDDRRGGWRPGRDRCVSSRQLDNVIEDQGYRRVRITDFGRRVTEARAERRGVRYALIVDSCTGRVLDRDRVRR